MFSKILVANRGEIAIRALRAGVELGARTVAVYPHEDRNSFHRQKSDEAYRIGEEGHAVRAYLNIEEIIRVAKDAEVDAIYPGYGFLSENPDLARACEAAGITFIGPPADVLESTGDKVKALRAAKEAGVPVLQSSEPSTDTEELTCAAEEIGFPIFVKAVVSGGGRGMRRVDTREDLAEALRSAMHEAETAFGNATVFLEQAVIRPRHIEVQILADAEGNVVHLFERDCSLQRRYQKVVEIAPAPSWMRASGRRCTGTPSPSPRPWTTAMLKHCGVPRGHRRGARRAARVHRDEPAHPGRAHGHRGDHRHRPGRRPDAHRRRGDPRGPRHPPGGSARPRVRHAVPDHHRRPANDFRPDIGTVTVYRSVSGSGIRLDGGTIYTGAEISPHFDSMLVKLTARGRDHQTAIARARRALSEFRIRGVATNIPFLLNVLDSEEFIAGDVATDFIDAHPELATINRSQDRGSKALQYLADITVNQPHGPRVEGIDPRDKLPRFPGDKTDEPDRSPFDGPSDHPKPDGWRQVLLAEGPEGFAKRLREQTALAVTDTTFRDAHQSLLATRVRTRDLLAAAPPSRT